MSPDDMNEEQLLAFLKRRNFEEDEIKVMWPNEAAMRKAVADIQALKDDDADDGFAWDKEDKTKLNKDQQAQINALKASGKKKKARLREIELEKKKLDAEIAKQSKAAGVPEAEETEEKEPVKDPSENFATEAEVKASMADINKLLALDDEDEEE